jgi:NAD(P)-dependent dehydrogenase (short-subunit alcohol dehydrogenase family)
VSTQPSSSSLLDGKVAIVTGGVGAIGQAVARAFVRHGAQVAIADLDEAACHSAAAMLADQTGDRVIGVAVDVTSKASLEAAADQIEESLGHVNVVVANAGIFLAQAALDTGQGEWERVLQVNLTGSLLTAQVFGQRLHNAGRPGSIIFTSSLFGIRGGRGNSAYSASKFGIIGLAQSMAAELAPHGIRVNSVCPGQIQSHMMDALFEGRAQEAGTSAEEERTKFLEKIPIGRMGTTDEVANGYVYLASDLSSYVTGHALLIDGGWQVG